MINSVFFVIVLSVLALLPFWVASLFLFGECRQVTANVIGEAEVSTWEEVRRFWWLFAIGIGLWIAFVALTGRYYNLIQIVSFIAVMLDVSPLLKVYKWEGIIEKYVYKGDSEGVKDI